MSTITASSTLEELRQEYVANASYEEDNSVAKCKAFITAARALLVMLPATATGFGGEAMVQFQVGLTEKALESAKMWLHSRATGHVIHADFSNLRS